MRVVFCLAAIVITACNMKDDALYAPWVESSRVYSDKKDSNLDKIINYGDSKKAEEIELCVTQLKHPHKQTCTKELTL